jgi:hypothetical protein
LANVPPPTHTLTLLGSNLQILELMCKITTLKLQVFGHIFGTIFTLPCSLKCLELPGLCPWTPHMIFTKLILQSCIWVLCLPVRIKNLMKYQRLCP